MLINGKKIAHKIEQETLKIVVELKEKGAIPRLSVILVGSDPASLLYVRRKGASSQRLGIEFICKKFGTAAAESDVISFIEETQNKYKHGGIIVQLPLPREFNTRAILEAIRPENDVDCLTELNLGKVVANTALFLPPTASAICAILEELEVDLKGKVVAVVGTGLLVGIPISMLLAHKSATVIICNEHTRDLREQCLRANIIISAVGKKDLIRGDTVASDAIVIDVGTDFIDGKVCGDVKVEEVEQVALYVTPTPGGVGPITVQCLLRNVVLCAKRTL